MCFSSNGGNVFRLVDYGSYHGRSWNVFRRVDWTLHGSEFGGLHFVWHTHDVAHMGVFVSLV